MSKRDEEERRFVETASRILLSDIVEKLLMGDPSDPHPFAGLSASAPPGCPDTGGAERAGGINPAVPAQDLQRAARARQWRRGRGYTLPQLSALAGLSVTSITDCERGYRLGGSGRPVIPDSAWRRYGLIVAALDAGLEPMF